MFDVNQIIPKSINSKLQMTEITGICLVVLF